MSGDPDGMGARALRRFVERTRTSWAKSRDRIANAYREDRGLGRAQWARVDNVLRPRDRPQERVLSPLCLIAKVGLEAWHDGLSMLDPLQPGHVLLHQVSAAGTTP